jgi:hypothetical protein
MHTPLFPMLFALLALQLAVEAYVLLDQSHCAVQARTVILCVLTL